MSHPSPADGAVRCVRAPSHDSAGSRRGNDYTPVTVDDVSSSLDCSGCRMPVLVSVPEGLRRRLLHCGTKVGAYNTIRALLCQKGLKAPVPLYLDGTFLQARRAWPSILRLA